MSSAPPPIQEPSNVSTATKPRKPLVVPLVIFALCTAFGIAGGIAFGFLLSTLSPQLYESSATIHIEPRNNQLSLAADVAEKAPEQTVQHQFHIHSELIVERCLEVNSLYRLKSLDGFEKDEAVQMVLQNLSVAPNPRDNSIYVVTYRSNDPTDSRTILANLLDTYRHYLDEKYRADNDQLVAMLRKLIDELQQNYGDLVQQIASVKQQGDPDQKEIKEQLEVLERERQQVKEMLEKNHEKLANVNLNREFTGFQFTYLQQPDPGVKSGTSLTVFMLYGIAAGLMSCGTMGLVIALIVRSAFSS